MPTLTPTPEQQDEKLNPSQQDFLKDFEGRGVLSDEELKERRGQHIGANQDAASQEKQAVGDTMVGKAAVQASQGLNPVLGGAVKLLAKFKTKKGIGAGVVALLLIAIIGIGSLFTTAIAPIAFLSNVINDLNDQLPALDDRNEKLMRTKITSGDRAEVLKGCTKMSLRCKYKSMSKSDIERFNRAGVTVEGDSVAGRTFPKSFKIGDKSYTPAEFSTAIDADPVVKDTFKTAINMRSLGFMDKINAKMMEKFGISKTKPTFNGDVDEEYAKLAAGEKSPGLTGDAKFTPVEGEEGKFTLDGDTSGRTYTQAEVNNFRAPGSPIDTIAGTTGKSLEQFAKTINITGSVDMICSLKNAIGYAATAAKVAKYARLVKYVAPVAAAVYAIQAGDGTQKDGEVIGKFFGDPDVRKTILDQKGTVESGASVAASGGAVTASNLTQKEVTNPYYGKNAMDSPLYKLSTGGPVVNTQSEGTAQYSLSLSENKVASILETIGVVVGLGTVGATTCKIVQNWFARGASLIVGIAAMFVGVGEVNWARNIAIATGVTIGFIFIAQFLSSITQQEPVSKDITSAPEERGAVAWTGISGMTGESARMSGLIPGNAEQIVAYSTKTKQSNLAYDKIEGKSVSLLDTSSPYSTLSKMASSLNQYRITNFDFSGISASFGSILGSAASKPFTQAAFAATTDVARFKQCDDDQYKALGIDADVQCNLRYIMPQADLDLDVDEVAKYMEGQNSIYGKAPEQYVETDTETGLPPGYTEPTATDMNVGEQLISGAINSIYNTRNTVNDYGTYLDYCVYRAMPFGETYEENGAFGAVSDDWKTGKRCLSNDMMIRAFRIYTLTNRAVDITEDPPAVSSTGGTTAPPTSGQPVPASGFAWPLGQDLWKQYRSDFLGGHYLAGNFIGPTTASDDISFPGALGKPVYAMLGGTVVKQPLGRSSHQCHGTPDGNDNGGIQIQSNIDGHTVVMAYAHGANVLFTTGQTVQPGQQIMSLGNVGNSCGAHMHMDATVDGNNICLQDLFLAMDSGAPINLDALVQKTTPGCYGRS